VRLILDGSGLKTDILLLGSEDRGEWRAYPWWDENFQWQCVCVCPMLVSCCLHDLIWYDMIQVEPAYCLMLCWSHYPPASTSRASLLALGIQFNSSGQTNWPPGLLGVVLVLASQ
jgi:hypothetical protein